MPIFKAENGYFLTMLHQSAIWSIALIDYWFAAENNVLKKAAFCLLSGIDRISS